MKRHKKTIATITTGLSVKRETVRRLSDEGLQGALGGASSEECAGGGPPTQSNYAPGTCTGTR